MPVKNPLWAKAINTCADPQRARHFLDLLAVINAGTSLDRVSVEQAQVLTALFSGSPALSNLLVANPDWMASLDIEHIRHPRRKQGLRSEVMGWLKALLEARDFSTAYTRLRQFKQQQMLRIAVRDLARLANAPEITREISDVADVCLDSLLQICRQQFTGRFGQPYHQDANGQWHTTEFCVLGVGKLGGRELNYSSDVDVLFVYSEEGQVFKEPPTKKKTPAASMSSHPFFNRLAEAYIAEVTRMTTEGYLYRIDLRLRPEGDAGPLCRSLTGYENYYAQWGQTWERMMLIKARCVAGAEGLAAEFLEMIQPFRFPRSVNTRVINEVAVMKERIENEIVRAGELERNVKLGRGGIREIEFIVQSLQLLHAGRQPFLQIAQTLPCLAKLVQYRLLKADEAAQLEAAYCFLRDVEHRLQMEENLQTHTIPADLHAQERLAKLMGFRTLKSFEAARREHSSNVRRVYDQLLRAEKPEPPSPFPRTFDGAETEWKALLARHWFRDVDTAFRVLREFVEGPGYTHVSPRTVELGRQLLPRLFGLCRTDDGKSDTFVLPPKTLSDPDRVVTRLDNFISAYGTRATLFELWNSNATFFELLLLLFDRSEFLAEALIRSPELLDDLVFGGRLTARKTAREILSDLRHGFGDADQHAWLRRYHEAELMRIGLRDILGLVDFEQNLIELSALADACLQYAVEVVVRKSKLQTAPFVVIGLGKLGGNEINYGSDLDIIFVADSKAKNLPNLQRLAVDVMDLVSRRTAKGAAFHADARLRPDGEKGLLVNTLNAYEEYYSHRAQLWEIQSLTRTRSVAGDFKLGEWFQKLAAALTDFKTMSQKPVTRSSTTLAPSDGERDGVRGIQCYSPNWKTKIHEMRMRIEKERTPPGKDDLAIKTGKGGLMDAEFIAQALCLEHGWQEAHTLRALERARDARVLQDGDKLIENYRQLRRVEGILRRWSYEGETVLPDDPAPYYRVSVRCGFATSKAFAAALANWRGAIREMYLKVFVG
jgi:glutamate-ammonia-ligase adenylyltransferase